MMAGNPAGQTLLSCTSNTPSILAWNFSETHNVRLSHALPVDGPVSGICWNYDLSQFAVSSTKPSPNPIVRIYDFNRRSLVESINCNDLLPVSQHASQIPAIRLAFRNSSRLLFFTHMRTLRIFDRQTQSFLPSPDSIRYLTTCLDLHLDESKVIFASTNGEIALHSLTSNNTTTLQSSSKQQYNDVKFWHFKKSTVAAANDDGLIRIWDLNHGKSMVLSDRHMASAKAIMFAPSNKDILCSVGLDSALNIYDGKNGCKLIRKYNVEAPLISLAMNDLNTIAVGTITGKVIFFDIRSSTPLASANAHDSAVTSLLFPPPSWELDHARRETSRRGGNLGAELKKVSQPVASELSQLVAENQVTASISQNIVPKVVEKNYMDMFSPLQARTERRSVTDKARKIDLEALTKDYASTSEHQPLVQPAVEPFLDVSQISELNATFDSIKDKKMDSFKGSERKLKEQKDLGNERASNAISAQKQQTEMQKLISDLSTSNSKPSRESIYKNSNTLEAKQSLEQIKVKPKAISTPSVNKSVSSVRSVRKSASVNNTSVNNDDERLGRTASRSSVRMRSTSTTRMGNELKPTDKLNGTKSLQGEKPRKRSGSVSGVRITSDMKTDAEEKLSKSELESGSLEKSRHLSMENYSNASAMSMKNNAQQKNGASILPRSASEILVEKSEQQTPKSSAEVGNEAPITNGNSKASHNRTSLAGIPVHRVITSPQENTTLRQNTDNLSFSTSFSQLKPENTTPLLRNSLIGDDISINPSFQKNLQSSSSSEPQPVSGERESQTYFGNQNSISRHFEVENEEEKNQQTAKKFASNFVDSATANLKERLINNVTDTDVWLKVMTEAETKEVADPEDVAIAPGMPSYKVLENVINDCLEDFREEIKNDVRNMHLELLKQFHIQRAEITTLFEQYSPTASLLAEIQRLREENERLRRNY